MKRGNVIWIALLAVLLGASQVFAGAVYVPVAQNEVEQGIRYQTHVWVTNTGSGVGTFTPQFIVTLADGTQRDDANPVSIDVPPGGTFFLNNVAPDGQRGLLEIDADPHLVVTSRLVSILPNGTELLGATVPVISSDNLVPADETAHILGVLREGDKLANLGLANLGLEEITCVLSAFRFNGSQIADTVEVSLNPLTQAQFDDVLGFIGEAAVQDSRFEATCNQPFYLYTTLFDRSSGESAFLGPSTDGASALRTPGDDGGGPATCPANAECFSTPGVVHVPQPNNRVKRVSFPVSPGNYNVIRAKVDVTVGPWAPGNSNGLHNIFWFARNRNRDLVGYVNVWGPNTNAALVRHGFGVPQHEKTRFVRPLSLQPGQTYEFDYLYDTNRRLSELVVRRGGQELLRMGGGPPNVNTVSVGPDDLFHIDFGFTGVNPNEPPTFGWVYGNLRVEFVR